MSRSRSVHSWPLSVSFCSLRLQTHTDLERQVRIPWSEACMRGYGLDAVTGAYTGATVFQKGGSFVEKWDRKTNTKVSQLQWQTAREMQDDFNIGVGTTVNVLSHYAVRANANIMRMVWQKETPSTILVQYKHEVHLTLDSSLPDIPVREEVQQLDEAAFTQRFGHYYVAGYDKVYRCCMTVKCKTKEETVTRSHALEAIAIVEKYLKGGIEFSDLNKETSKWSLLGVVVDTEGYSGGFNLSHKILNLKIAPRTLSKILNAKLPKGSSEGGFPHAVVLKHYSTLPSLRHVSRRIAVPPLNFERARVMRKLSFHLRDCCRPHPALIKYPHPGVYDAIGDVLDRFELSRRYLVRPGDLKESTIDELCRDLQTLEKRACTIIERYGFIHSMMDMDTSIVPHPPELVDDKYVHRWHCGRVTGIDGPSRAQIIDDEATTTSSLSRPFVDKSFGQYQEVFQLQWTTPMTTARTDFDPPAQKITFSTLDGFTDRQDQHVRWTWKAADLAAQTPQPPMPLNGHSRPNTPTPVFHHCVKHTPVYIIGWTLSCSWPKREPSPQVQAVYHQSEHILADRLAILVDNSCPARWHCTVFFVKRWEYKFPALLDQRPAPSIKQPSWLRRLFGMNK
ncbi:FHA domain-containing protein [Favolaschia claudopus]|uniref:FHA domain-containing protein n=1 Tax=Favolaschia claudopus TaxID=2862362 RepID=A0AAW0DQZ8_9AGAR